MFYIRSFSSTRLYSFFLWKVLSKRWRRGCSASIQPRHPGPTIHDILCGHDVMGIPKSYVRCLQLRRWNLVDADDVVVIDIHAQHLVSDVGEG